ncbi:MAG: ABC transporter substrate-binding protein [Cycloclasticus sp.]|jgi:iron complex transport system substrate-binding protein|nr:ABC transporter substrate-binding protein [Cycloclasticus sp.]
MELKHTWLLISFFIALLTSVNILAKPQRIVSLNLCADQLLMALLPPERLIGITQLASDPEASYLYQEASQFHQHSSRIEDIMALKPDLVVAGEFTAQPTNQLLEELGYNVIKLGLPATSDGIFQQVSFLGQQIGEPARAEALILKLREELTRITALQEKKHKRAVVYYANGFTAGRHTIVNEILEMAGLINIAAELNLDFIAPLSLESLLASKPDVLLLGRLDENTDSLAHQVLQHEAINRYTELKQVQKIMIPDRYWTCAGPSSFTAAAYLQQSLLSKAH